MKAVLDRDQSRSFDALARDTCNVPGALLMENAGRGAAALLQETRLQERPEAPALVVCGTGNNGGDGFVIARHLLVYGRSTKVLVAGEESRVGGDARTMLDAFRGIGGDAVVLPASECPTWLARESSGGSVIVDALFGTGLDRPLSEPFVDLVRSMNASQLPRFAVDLPSGLDANTGMAQGAVVTAAVTATFGSLKRGLLTPNGAENAGVVHVVDIGVPSSLSDRLGPTAFLLDEAELRRLLSSRPAGLHKYGAGHLLVVAGSVGKSGAALLAARGAMRSGAGLVTVASWPEAVSSIELRSLETMTSPLPASGADDLATGELARGKRALVVGPGLGLDERAERTVHAFVRLGLTAVLDADAITLMARRPDLLRSGRDLVLTPHAGELARLLGVTSADINADRFAAVKRAAEHTSSVVVLKGAHSLIAAPDGRIAVSPVAAPALAVAGSGDVLSGVIGALLCSLMPFEAACAGVLVHAFAGASFQRTFGDRGLLASEIADRIPTLMAGGYGATQGTSSIP